MHKRASLLGALLCIAGCQVAASQPPAAQSQAAPARLVQPKRETWQRVFEQPGTIQAMEETPLFARIPGYVKAVRADIGDRVRQGAVLAELFVPEVEEEVAHKLALVAQSKAEVEQSRASFKAAEAGVATAKALVQQAMASRARAEAEYQRWQSEHARVKDLVKRRVIDEQTRDETEHQFKSAEANREEVEAKVKSAEAGALEASARRDKAQSDIHAAEARQQVAEADHRRAQAMFGYARILSPFDGVVTRRHIDTGHFVQPATASVKGEPLFVVVRPDPVRVFVEIPELEAVLVTNEAKARIRVQALAGQELPEGKLTRSAWALDPKTRTLRAEIDFPNPDGRIRPGMYAYASIRLDRPNVWSLPATAVLGQGDQAHCYRVAEGKAVKQPLRIGAREDGKVEVLKFQAKKGAATNWEDPAGTENVLAVAAGATEGQAIQ